MRIDPATQDQTTAPVGLPPEARVMDRRRHQRISVNLLGRYMLADRQEYPCQIIDISPGGAALVAPVSGMRSERVVCYIDHIGRIEADEKILAANSLLPGTFVLVVGNLAAHKNLSALGALAKSLAKSNVKLVITGSFGGKAFRELPSLTLPEPALYIGRVSDEELKALYRAAACFVFPSRYEGFGLPVAEAMTCGCPVIASDIPVLREIFSESALFCDPLSPDDIAAKVMQLLADETLQSRLSEAGIQQTKTMTWQRSGAELHAIIEDLVW